MGVEVCTTYFPPSPADECLELGAALSQKWHSSAHVHEWTLLAQVLLALP